MLSKDLIQRRLRVALVDSSPVFRLGLETVFNRNSHIQLVYSGDDFGELLENSDTRLDILVTDLSTDRDQTLQALANIQRKKPRTRVLAFIHPADVASILVPHSVSIAGYQIKAAPMQEILSSLMEVCAGNTTIASSLTTELVQQVARSFRPKPPRLTQRQTEVLELLSQGRTNVEIANKLHITVPTVKYHVTSIFSKLKVRNRTQAASLMASTSAA